VSSTGVKANGPTGTPGAVVEHGGARAAAAVVAVGFQRLAVAVVAVAAAAVMAAVAVAVAGMLIAGSAPRASADTGEPVALVAPRAPRAPAAACEQGGWQRVNILVPVWTLAGRDDVDVVYAGSPGADGASTLYSGSLESPELWAPLPALSAPVTGVAIGPEPDDLVVGLYGAGVVRSSDRGASFGIDELPGTWVTAVAADDTTAYAASSKREARGIWRAAGPGASWERLDGDPIPTTTFWSMAVAPDGAPWVTTEGFGAQRWNGTAWELLGDADLQRSTVLAVAFDARDPELAYAALGSTREPAGESRLGLRVTRDGGVTWSAYGGPLGDRAAFANRVVRAVATSGMRERAYASVWGDGLFVTSDGGDSWTRVPAPTATTPYFEALLALVPEGRAPLQCELLFAGSPEGLWVRNVAPSAARFTSLLLPLVARDAILSER